MSSPSPHRSRGRWVLALSSRSIAFLLASCPVVHGLSYEAVINPTGEEPGERFGASVANAGDVNGDGFDDVIVGGTGHDGAGDRSGVARLYFGGVDMDDVADLVFMGSDSLAALGVAVATAGDVNGDGYADVIVGASGSMEDPGTAYVYYGGAAADTIADLTFVGEAPHDKFGWAVASAGDINADGYDDLIVGAKFNDEMASGAGRAYVYYGGPGADGVADLIMNGQIVSDEFGYAVASAGDVNNDGYDDFAVGAPFVGGTFSGRVFVYFGGADPDTTADWVIDGINDENLGTAIAAGDVNGDGFSDLFLGAENNREAGPHTGRVVVYHGGRFPNNVWDQSLHGRPYDGTGEAVSTGDVNSDGYADIIVGAPTVLIGTDRGRTYVHFGGPGMDMVPDLTVTGEVVGDNFGYRVACAGDVNGDGHDDLIVGASRDTVAGDNAGRAYLYTVFPYRVIAPNGGESWIAGSTVTVRWKGHDVADIALSTDTGASWSTLVSGVGGQSDNTFTLTAPWSPTEAALIRLSYSGTPITHATSDHSDGPFRILLPAPDAPIADRIRIADLGEDEADEFGRSVARVGDMNGDGFDDVVVGASHNDNVAGNAGAAYVYVGGQSDDAPALTLTGAGPTDYFGRSVAGGDVNGDGFSDVVVGSPLDDTGGSSMGRVYVYYGSSVLDDSPDHSVGGEAAGDWFGSSVASSGDVNGDGYDDMLIGASSNDAGGNAAGRAYLFLGGQTPGATPQFALTGEAEGDHLGQSVAIAGDVNGDGYADILVGAPDSDAGGAGAGRAYLCLGGAVPDGSPELVITGESRGDALGLAVSGVGDVNGDGMDDFALGAPDANAAGSDAGRVYIYFGGSVLPDGPDVVLDGHAPNEQFGYVISTAGDVNDDGFSDLLVGAPQLVQEEDEPGRAYVYYGGPLLDNEADLTFVGSAAGDGFGSAVSTAGDFMRDGFSDLVLGAPQRVMDQDRPGYIHLHDLNRYHMLDPIGGDTWNVGARETISWLGAEPADVSLSADGGLSYQSLRSGVGGQEENTLQVLVPHLPSRFSRIRITATDPSVSGGATCDSLFTIDAAIVLTALRVGPPPEGRSGVLVTWQTDPGPDALSGYCLERAALPVGSGPGSDASPRVVWDELVALTRETSYLDGTGTPASRYRLTAINGLGEAFVLGEAQLSASAALTAHPLPYRGGTLTITFVTRQRMDGGPAPTMLAIYDVSGRLVRWLTRGVSPPGVQRTTWDGRDEAGVAVANGMYFLRSVSGGQARTQKVTVLR